MARKTLSPEEPSGGSVRAAVANALDGVFDDTDADRIVEIVRGFNASVGARFGRAALGSGS